MTLSKYNFHRLGNWKNWINKSFLFITFLAVSCNKLVEVDTPAIYTSGDNVFTTNGGAISVLNGIYASMSSMTLSKGTSLNSFMSLYPGLSSDEFTLYSGVTNVNYIAYYKNALINTSGPNIWLTTYPFIYKINAAIEGITASSSLTEIIKSQLLGEAKFLRAFSYFYLVNLYGQVPLVLTSNYKVNELLSRASEDVVYQQISLDLQDASSLLSNNFVGSDGHSASSERIVPTVWAAKALQARVALYRRNYSDAVAFSTIVLSNTTLFGLTALNDVFLKNSNEAIWQLQPVNLNWNTEDARLFIIPKRGPSNTYPVYLNSRLLDSFEENDQRLTNWVAQVKIGNVTYKYPYKYKSATSKDPVTEYQMVLRLAEQYLIRAEANAQLNKLSDAIADLNVIRNRAGLSDYAGEETQLAILNAIFQERRVEFFSEWGNRWLDLKRSGSVNNVMLSVTSEKGGTWNSYDQYYPIYSTEIQYNPNLNQNEGY